MNMIEKKGVNASYKSTVRDDFYSDFCHSDVHCEPTHALYVVHFEDFLGANKVSLEPSPTPERQSYPHFNMIRYFIYLFYLLGL